MAEEGSVDTYQAPQKAAVISAWERNFPRIHYGYVIIASATGAFVVTTPGTTFGIGLFTSDFMESLHVSRTLVSSFWTVSLIGTGVVLPMFGRSLDRVGGRKAFLAMTPPFVLSILLLGTINSGWYLPFLFFVLRLGMLGLQLAGNNAVTMWWIKRRGLAASVVNTVASANIAYPSLLYILRAQFGWRGTFYLQAVVVLLLCAFLYSFIFDRPEPYGLLPDGGRMGQDPEKDKEATAAAAKSSEELEGWPWRDALKTAHFWLNTFALVVCGFLWAGFNFHFVSILADGGFDSSVEEWVFLPISAGALLTALVSGKWYDWLRYKHHGVATAAATCCISSFLIVYMNNSAWVLLFGLIYGSMDAMGTVGFQTVYPVTYGRKNIGTIDAVCKAFETSGVGIGPLVFGLVKDYAGSFTPILITTGILGGLMTLVLFFLPLPVPPPGAMDGATPRTDAEAGTAETGGDGDGVGLAAHGEGLHEVDPADALPPAEDEHLEIVEANMNR